MQGQGGQLSGLNALRFFAGIVVLLAHAHFDLYHKGVYIYNGDLPILNKGKDGVNLFFALSGFLLTYLSLSKPDTIGRFYLRRILRIWPLYYLCVFLGFFVLDYLVPYLTGENYLVFPAKEGIWYYIFFLPNYMYAKFPVQNIGALTILWSIGVEEQFYLFFPFLIKLLKKVRRPLLVIFAIITAYIIIYFLIGYSIIPVSKMSRSFCETLKFHFMFSGIFFAILYVRHKDLVEKYILNRVSQLAIILMTILKFFTDFSFTPLCDQIISVILFPLLILVTVGSRKKIFNPDNAILVSLGSITYGIYMFHPYVSYIIRFAILKIHAMENFFLAAPLLYFVALFFLSALIAQFSYKYYELFFLELKKNIEIKTGFIFYLTISFH